MILGYKYHLGLSDEKVLDVRFGSLFLCLKIAKTKFLIQIFSIFSDIQKNSKPDLKNMLKVDQF